MQRIICLFLCAVTFGQLSPTIAQEGTRGIHLTNCQVILINNPTLYAAKPGKLIKGPNEGDRVESGDLVAQIDDTEALLSYQAALYEKEVAQKKADNDVDIRYAEAQEKVTEAEYDEAVKANERAPGALSESETRRRKFQHKRSGLATEQARRDHDLAVLEVKLAQAKVQAAKHEWETRRLSSDFTGIVSERYMQVGEWVNAGDPIAKLMQLDKIRVLGYVKANSIARSEVIGKPVVVEVRLSGNRLERVEAKIDHAGFEVDQAGMYKVWADIDNVADESGDFALHPGCTAEMLIDVAGQFGRNAQFIPAPGL